MYYPNRIFSREEIVDLLWGADAVVDPRSVDVSVRRLRGAITREGEPGVIRTVRAAGYVLEVA
jgi:two-component system phosphate regulon response regulator PhoB